MAVVFQFFGFCRRIYYRNRRFWRRLYYGLTEILMIIGGSVVLFGIWHFCFGGGHLW